MHDTKHFAAPVSVDDDDVEFHEKYQCLQGEVPFRYHLSYFGMVTDMGSFILDDFSRAHWGL